MCRISTHSYEFRYEWMFLLCKTYNQNFSLRLWYSPIFLTNNKLTQHERNYLWLRKDNIIFVYQKRISMKQESKISHIFHDQSFYNGELLNNPYCFESIFYLSYFCGFKMSVYLISLGIYSYVIWLINVCLS